MFDVDPFSTGFVKDNISDVLNLQVQAQLKL